MNLTSIWTRLPGSFFSYRLHRRSCRLQRWEDGSRFMPSFFSSLVVDSGTLTAYRSLNGSANWPYVTGSRL